MSAFVQIIYLTRCKDNGKKRPFPDFTRKGNRNAKNGNGNGKVSDLPHVAPPTPAALPDYDAYSFSRRVGGSTKVGGSTRHYEFSISLLRACTTSHCRL